MYFFVPNRFKKSNILFNLYYCPRFILILLKAAIVLFSPATMASTILRPLNYLVSLIEANI